MDSHPNWRFQVHLGFGKACCPVSTCRLAVHFSHYAESWQRVVRLWYAFGGRLVPKGRCRLNAYRCLPLLILVRYFTKYCGARRDRGRGCGQSSWRNLRNVRRYISQTRTEYYYTMVIRTYVHRQYRLETHRSGLPMTRSWNRPDQGHGSCGAATASDGGSALEASKIDDVAVNPQHLIQTSLLPSARGCRFRKQNRSDLATAAQVVRAQVYYIHQYAYRGFLRSSTYMSDREISATAAGDCEFLNPISAPL